MLLRFHLKLHLRGSPHHYLPMEKFSRSLRKFCTLATLRKESTPAPGIRPHPRSPPPPQESTPVPSVVGTLPGAD